jgi:hypothetical protein
MVSILNNATKWPPDHIKNTVAEIRLDIYAWIIPTPHIVALDCIFTIVVEFTLKNRSKTYITHPIPLLFLFDSHIQFPL